MEHIPGTSCVTVGIEGYCSCGWRSGKTWPETDEGLAQARNAAKAHKAAAESGEDESSDGS